jgi:hypothetical protein
MATMTTQNIVDILAFSVFYLKNAQQPLPRSPIFI